MMNEELEGKISDELTISGMVRDFLLRTDMDAHLAEICCKVMEEEKNGGVCLPVTADEISLLKASPLVKDASKPEAENDDCKLFVLAHGRLYTRRNWRYEQSVKRRIEEMAMTPFVGNIDIPTNSAFEGLKERQREAIRQMGSHQFSIMTGGPGTGKTYTIARAVKLIQEQKPGLTLGLAAPTGKAKARMKEAMLQEAKALELEKVPDAQTLHSLLKPNYDFVTFKHNHDNHLDLDWLIVDEASMISLSMMAKLLDALKPTCGLTLVGDACQLSSVEPGKVFGDLCRMRVVNECGCKCELIESNRFQAGGEIATLADFINSGDSDNALKCLKNPQNKLVEYICLNQVENKMTRFRQIIEEGFEEFCRQDTPEGALSELNNCRVLCAVRKGRFGCEMLNTTVQSKLRKLNPRCPIPMMITRNDGRLGVSNGDVGVIMPQQGEELYLPDKEKPIPLTLLPNREMAFASTIHKAQGSEFNYVIIVLPPINELEEDAPVNSLLTRELLYTALTRTKPIIKNGISIGKVYIIADDESIRKCCENETIRNTGLLADDDIATT